MNSTIHYNDCPACGSSSIKPVLTAIDHTVSGEKFAIWECADCTLRFTQDVPAEKSIERYYQSEDYISHTNTSKGFINRIYLAVRKRTLKQKIKLIGSVTNLKGGRILDLGSGTGAFVHEMQSHGWNATGLEPDGGARKIAKEMFDCELKNVDELFKLEKNSFDVITLWHVLEHVHDLHNYLRQLRSLLKENGRLIIAVPNYTSVDAGFYKENWAAYDVPRHLYHFSPVAMEKLMLTQGMSILAYKPMWFDSFYVSLLSEKYKKGKTNFIAATWTGLRSNLDALKDTKKCSSLIYIISK